MTLRIIAISNFDVKGLMLVNRLIHKGTSKEVRILFLYLFVNSRGGPSRLKIVSLLRRRHLNANQLSIELGMDYKSISHNLDVLKKNNLVDKSDARYGAFTLSLLC